MERFAKQAADKIEQNTNIFVSKLQESLVKLTSKQNQYEFSGD